MDPREQVVVSECTVAEAAGILGVSGRSVLRLIEQGVVRARSAALPTSLRPRYRIPLIDIVELRSNYQTRETKTRCVRPAAESTPEADLKLLGF